MGEGRREMADNNSTRDVETQSVELSRVLVTITNHLLQDANEGEPPHEHLSIADVIEDHLASEITLDDVDRAERAVPGTRAQFLRWLSRRR
jgi:hypothetical protein